MRNMTQQEVFDRVSAHLLKQMTRSSYESTCLYFGPQGANCAVGCLLPPELRPFFEDDKYTTLNYCTLGSLPVELESLVEDGVLSGNLASEVSEIVSVLRQHRPLLVRLQKVHDDYDPEDWADHLGVAARTYGVSYARPKQSVD